MKAIKIDVIAKEVKEIELEPGIKNIYRELDCDLFTVIYPMGLLEGDCIYIDDEGLLRQPPLGAFYIKGFPQVLSGHGLVIGTDDEGDSISASTPLQQIKALVRFEDPHYLPEPFINIIID